MNNLLSLILGEMHTGLIVLDQDYSVVIWNRQAENITGKKASRVTGAKFADIYPHISCEDLAELLRSKFIVFPSDVSAVSKAPLRARVDSLFAEGNRYSLIQFGANLASRPDPVLARRRFYIRTSGLSNLKHSFSLALERSEFLVHYQPRININTRKIVGVEALARWRHPEKGLLSPAEFIPLAEETGLIVPLGEWLMRSACVQNKAWQDQGLTRLRVSVNLSARQLRQHNFVEMVDRVLKESGLEPRWLELEIPENTAVQNEEYTVMMLQELNEMGVQVSLDHFGAGHAPLRYLRRLQFSNLKIDRSLVRNITSDQEDASSLSSIIALGKSLKLTVIAEGVETEEQLSILKQQRCDEVQGYLFSKPVPAEEFKALLARERISIIIASNSSGYRMALKNMLDKASGIFSVVDMVGLAEITASAINNQPQAVLCEVGEGRVPITLLQRLKKDCPQTAVVLITERDDDSVAVDAVKAGADTFLRTVSPGYLSRILEIVCQDDLIMFSRSFKAQIQKMTALLDHLVPEPPVELNPKEKEIYDLLTARIQGKG